MDEPAQSVAEGPASPLARWAAALPPPPFVNVNAGPDESRFVPLSPRVVVLIAAAAVAGLVLWMARDSIRPFILGLLFVYLLDPPVRWLVRRGVRRTFAILFVYVVGIILFIEFLALTLTPLVNEVVRFVNDFPKLADSLDLHSSDSATSTLTSRSPSPSASGSTASSPGSARVAVAAVAAARPGVPAPARHRRQQLPRRGLRLLHPAGLGRLHPQRQDDARRDLRPVAPKDVAVRHLGGHQDGRA